MCPRWRKNSDRPDTPGGARESYTTARFSNYGKVEALSDCQPPLCDCVVARRTHDASCSLFSLSWTIKSERSGWSQAQEEACGGMGHIVIGQLQLGCHALGTARSNQTQSDGIPHVQNSGCRIERRCFTCDLSSLLLRCAFDQRRKELSASVAAVACEICDTSSVQTTLALVFKLWTAHSDWASTYHMREKM
ncbi:hypothetical protein BJX63DRAFT_357850 [Aspergillus granulosus]|uniref:Uncharacterized protein n=1 Tax=Aspergillus granulosus TaxID=176169 RepID=A0ABR4H1U0_9EURO